ncbi:HMG1/2-like protein isoform X1 [Cryptomeria japonica]|uniref:HMG1/2-like protein isoform X1 n=2 Tax=Cryptomeria japonica TaxID=3369 RepID=UPI0025AC9509|nr:HMG1/2-like protein isoform X1 [Cryptomeria japonica]
MDELNDGTCLQSRLRRMKETKAKKGSAATETKNRKAADKKKSLSVKETNSKKKPSRAEAKAKKDPNQPKRPPTAFFVFLEEFRKTFKEENPNVKGVTAVGKACGEKWKEMSEKEKAPYLAKAQRLKSEYEKSMTSYKKKKDEAEEVAQEESEKSKSEINDDEDDEDDEEEEDEEEDDDE